MNKLDDASLAFCSSCDVAAAASGATWCFGSIGEAFLSCGSALYGMEGVARLAAVSNAFKIDFFNDHHPWKQKKYENALAELKNGFLLLSGTALLTVVEQLESETFLSPLKEKLLIVLKSLAEKTADFRYTYYTALYQLRQALESPEFGHAIANKAPCQAARCLLHLCEARYASVHLYSFCEHLVDRALVVGLADASVCKLQRSDFEAIDQACFSAMGARRVAVKKGCLQGWLNIGFDPAMQQNVPFVLMDISFRSQDGCVRKVRFLRMGSPTIEGYIHMAQINPEFRGFMQALALQGRRHLYVSLQSDLSYGVGSESGRNRAIKDLQKDFSNLCVVVLDQDSDFYKQQGDFGDLSLELFQDVFCARLLSEQAGYYFLPAWKNDPVFLQVIDEVFAICVKLVFKENAFPNNCERRNFIEIYHAVLLIFLTRYAHADSVNVTCKDAIDRAMKTLSLFLQIVLIAQGQAEDPVYQKMHKVLTHAPAFMVKKQAMIDSRRQRLMHALDVLNEPACQAAIAHLAEHFGLIGKEIYIEKRDAQAFLA